MRIVGASLGRCIHLAGLLNFFRLAEELGHRTELLGAALSPQEFAEALRARRFDLAVVSYRLSPDSARDLLADLKVRLASAGLTGLRLAFGGTPPVAEQARASGLFEAVFSGQEQREDLVAFLERQRHVLPKRMPAQDLVGRIAEQHPWPLQRHHLGLETVERTVENARQVALSGELDVLSLAPDQNAQEYFFRPEQMPGEGHGAGGVPVRRPEDLQAIYQATRCGNSPLLRCYAGTRDLVRWGEMCRDTIHIAWGAVPLFWYSRLDRRSDRPLGQAIRENQQAIRWYGQAGIPLEVNDSHQWSLRDAHDAVAVAAAYLAACNAKALGVRYYVAQYMLNTPPLTSPAMDLAKMLAKIELVESLHDRRFQSFRQVRTGLSSMPPDADAAKGHLAASVALGMALKPHIVHVVGYCEADHVATAREIIESCRIVRAAVRLAQRGLPDPAGDVRVRTRQRQLLREAGLILDAIRSLGRGTKDPLTAPDVLTEAVTRGILDAPHLCASGVAPGKVATLSVAGAQLVVDPLTGRALSERRRLAQLGFKPRGR